MDFNKIGSEASVSDDLTQEKAFERELPRAGIAMIRYVGYIETGKHLPKNPTHSASYKCIHIFELNHKDHLIKKEDGSTMPQRIMVHQSIGATMASAYRKLFKVMNKACDNKYKHFAQMLGTGFLGEIFHSHSDTTKKDYANLHFDGAWSLKKPVMVNPLDNSTTPVPIPETHGEVLGFLWENDGISDEDIVTMWESLYIKGERPDKSSKNWMQETIMENIEWDGSRTQSLTQEFVDLEEPQSGVDASMNELAGMAQETPTGDDVAF